MDKDDQIQAYERQKIIIKEVSKPDQLTLDLKYQQCIQQIKSEHSFSEDMSFDLPPQLTLTKQISVRKKQNISEQQRSQFLELNSQIDEEANSRNLDEDESFVETEYRTKKLPKINYYDVEIIGRKLKFELQQKLIPLSYMDQIFDCTDEECQDITVEEIIQILSAEPFLIVDEKERLLVARYLIEDNTQDYVLHNLMNSNSINIIKSVFKQLLGKYQLFSKQEKSNIEYYECNQGVDSSMKLLNMQFYYHFQNKIMIYLITNFSNELVLKNSQLLQYYHNNNSKEFLQKFNIKFLILFNSKIKECTLNDFEIILKSCEISLLPRQMEYLSLINFQICKQIEKLRYSELLDYFCNIQSL